MLLCKGTSPPSLSSDWEYEYWVELLLALVLRLVLVVVLVFATPPGREPSSPGGHRVLRRTTERRVGRPLLEPARAALGELETAEGGRSDAPPRRAAEAGKRSPAPRETAAQPCCHEPARNPRIRVPCKNGWAEGRTSGMTPPLGRGDAHTGLGDAQLPANADIAVGRSDGRSSRRTGGWAAAVRYMLHE